MLAARGQLRRRSRTLTRTSTRSGVGIGHAGGVAICAAFCGREEQHAPTCLGLRDRFAPLEGMHQVAHALHEVLLVDVRADAQLREVRHGQPLQRGPAEVEGDRVGVLRHAQVGHELGARLAVPRVQTGVEHLLGQLVAERREDPRHLIKGAREAPRVDTAPPLPLIVLEELRQAETLRHAEHRRAPALLPPLEPAAPAGPRLLKDEHVQAPDLIHRLEQPAHVLRPESAAVNVELTQRRTARERLDQRDAAAAADARVIREAELVDPVRPLAQRLGQQQRGALFEAVRHHHAPTHLAAQPQQPQRRRRLREGRRQLPEPEVPDFIPDPQLHQVGAVGQGGGERGRTWVTHPHAEAEGLQPTRRQCAADGRRRQVAGARLAQMQNAQRGRRQRARAADAAHAVGRRGREAGLLARRRLGVGGCGARRLRWE